MNQNRTKKRPSLYSILAFIIILTVVTIHGLQSLYTYISTKEKLVLQMQEQSIRTLNTLEKNIISMMEAYAPNEYLSLVGNEVERNHALAIVVHDFISGKVLGEDAFISGKISLHEDAIVDYEPQNSDHQILLESSYDSFTRLLISSQNKEIGRITIYMQNKVIQEELRSIIQTTLINAFFISIVLILSLFLALKRNILDPLENVVMAIEQKDAHGIPLTAMQSYEYKEVALLSESMNLMIEAIKHSQKALLDSEFRWKFAVDGNGDGLWDWNLQTDEVYFSRQWKKMLGFEEDEIQNNLEEWKKRVHPQDIQRVYKDVEQYFHGEASSYNNEHRVLCKDGSYKWIRDRGIIVAFSDDNKPLRMIGTHSDISQQKELELQIIQERNFVKTIVDNANAIIAVIRSDGTMSLLNDYGKKFTGYTEEEVSSEPFFWKRFLPREVQSKAISIIDEAKLGNSVKSHTNAWISKEGVAKMFEWSNALVCKEDGSLDYIFTIGIDITERYEAQQQLEFIAKHDSLTKLPNRFLFAELLGLAMRNVRRNKEYLALLFVDLDGFKMINDAFGHRAGDEVLSTTARRMQEIVRGNDIAARIGGDEFVIVINNLKNSDELMPVVERLLKEISEEVVYEGDFLKVSASIGISLYPQEDENISNELLLRQADQAMYEAKENGKNQYRYYKQNEVCKF